MLEQERDNLALKLLEIKASHPKVFENHRSTPKILFALIKSPDCNYHQIVTTPYLPFKIMQRLLGFVWMSGCFSALAISAAYAGGFWFAFLSLLFLCFSIFSLIMFCLIYLDAGEPIIEESIPQIEELPNEYLLLTDRVQEIPAHDVFKDLFEKYRKTTIS